MCLFSLVEKRPISKGPLVHKTPHIHFDHTFFIYIYIFALVFSLEREEASFQFPFGPCSDVLFVILWLIQKGLPSYPSLRYSEGLCPWPSSPSLRLQTAEQTTVASPKCTTLNQRTPRDMRRKRGAGPCRPRNSAPDHPKGPARGCLPAGRWPLTRGLKWCTTSIRPLMCRSGQDRSEHRIEDGIETSGIRHLQHKAFWNFFLPSCDS